MLRSTTPTSSSPSSDVRPRCSVTHGDLSTRLDSRPNPEEWTLPDGSRLKSHKYARSSFPRGERAERVPARPNVAVPFATEPSALREFLWGLIHGFGDLASIVRGALTCERTVLDKLPYRDRASPRPGGAVDPEKLERILDAQARGLFRRDGGGSDERGRDENGSDGTTGTKAKSSATATDPCSDAASRGFWKRRGGIVSEQSDERPSSSSSSRPRQTIISTWTLPADDEFDRRHRLAPRPKKESVGRGLALIAAINVALLWAGSRAPTGG